MSKFKHAFDFLAADMPPKLPALVAVYGDEPFLKQQVLERVCGIVDAESISSRDGGEAAWADVADELFTRSLFGGEHQVVALREADGFVSANRPQLEDLVAAERSDCTLILDLKSWPGNTRLAKAVAKTGWAIPCKLPEKGSGRYATVDNKRIAEWLQQHARSLHSIQLNKRQAAQVHELVGDSLGLMDGELSKLALFADEKGKLTDDQITDVVGGWRQRSTWDLLDAIAVGDASEALAQLDRLMLAGESPLAIYGAFSWSMRRFAAAVRFVEQQESQGKRGSLSAALESAGVSKFPKDRFAAATAQLRQIGRQRADRLYSMLLDADLKMKRSHGTPDRARFVLEQFIFELSTAIAGQTRQVV